MATECKICGRQYVRKKCDFCKREVQWIHKLETRRRSTLFPKKVANDVRRFKKEVETIYPENSYYITGTIGSGKTVHAAALLLAINKRNMIELKKKSYCFVTTPELLLKIRNTFNGAGSEQELIEYYSSVDYLVLDDFGTEKMTEWVFQTIYLIINRRYMDMKPVIITSNLSLEELALKMEDDRVSSRFSQMCKLLTFTNNDYRKQT